MYDVVVVGAGLAGSTAAAAAVDAGRKVLVLEKSERRPGWGNSLGSGGVLHNVYADPRREPRLMYDEIVGRTEGHARPDVARSWAENAMRTLTWLDDHGAGLVTDPDTPQSPLRARVFAPVKPTSPGLFSEGYGVYVFLTKLAQHTESGSGAIWYGARATTLVRSAEHWQLTVHAPDGHGTVTARSVVLADGGFQANPELLRKYVGSDRVKLRAADTGTGDALLMALSAGAAEAEWMNGFYGHLLCRDALTNDDLWPYPQIDALGASGVVVDGHGNRFVDESLGGIATANHIAWSEDPLGTWLIFDDAAWQGPAGTGGTTPANPHIVDHGGTVMSAPSIAQLAAEIGVDPAALTRSVDEVCGRTEGDVARRSPADIAAAPYHAIPLVAGVSFTMGGIAIDGQGCVLDRRSARIEGLYAAGGAAGGPNAGYGGGLLEAAVFGLLAGTSAAAEPVAADLGSV